MEEMTERQRIIAAILAIKIWVFGGVLRIPTGVEPVVIVRMAIKNSNFNRENFSWAVAKSLPKVTETVGYRFFTTNGLPTKIGEDQFSIQGGTWSIEWTTSKSGVWYNPYVTTRLTVSPDITAEDIEEVLEILSEE